MAVALGGGWEGRLLGVGEVPFPDLAGWLTGGFTPESLIMGSRTTWAFF